MALNIHILNGDALRERFPGKLTGKQLVCRECFVEGPVDELDLQPFYRTREKHLNTHYGHLVQLNYTTQVKAVFDKMTILPKESQIHFWFEEDLFCQVNFWFCLALVAKHNSKSKLFLVRPPLLTPFGFGGLTTEELQQCHSNRIRISNPKPFIDLWHSYQKQDLTRLKDIANGLREGFPFVEKAVNAHIESLPTADSKGRPKERLLQIMSQLKTENFGKIFQEFCSSEAIYGFGDLYVKRLYDELLEENKG